MPPWQPDGPYTPERALDELDCWWGALYDIWIQGDGFSACHRGGPRGEVLEGDTPDELDAAIRADRDLAGDELAQAAIREFEARGIDVVWIGHWLAIVQEDLRYPIVSRDGLPQLLGRVAELDAAGMLPA